MIPRKKLFPISFRSIEGDVLHLIGAPDILRQGNDNPAPLFLKGAAMCQHSVILLFIRFIPSDIPLCRKEGRQNAANICGLSRRISKALLGETIFRRHIESAALIGRRQHIAVYRQGLAAPCSNHTDGGVLEDCQQFSKELGLNKAHIIIDIDLVFGIGKSQCFICLHSIRISRRQRKKFRLISRRQMKRLQRFQTGAVKRLIRLTYEKCNFLFFFHIIPFLQTSITESHQSFQGALPLCHKRSSKIFSRSVSMHCQKPLCR